MQICSMYVSYSQFFIYDIGVLPGCRWTEGHEQQGFARRLGVLSIGTLIEYGEATLRVVVGAASFDPKYTRILRLPLEVISGSIEIQGPEELSGSRVLGFENGSYLVTISQAFVSEEECDVEVAFEKDTLGCAVSQILRADDGMQPPAVLIESAERP
jgi:hypothetical protein